MMRFAPLLVLVLSTLASPASGTGQNVTLDEGAFRLSLGGAPAGREEFSVRRAGMGDQAAVILRGSLEWEGSGPVLSLGTVLAAQGEGMNPQEYQVRVTKGDALDVYVARSGSRFVARTVSAAGEQVREYRAGPGSIILDERVAHHHVLLTPFLEETAAVSLTVLIPRAGRQTRMTLSRLGEEEISVGGILLSARRYRLDGDGATRDLWFDGQGRLLRVEEPGTGYLAERESIS